MGHRPVRKIINITIIIVSGDNNHKWGKYSKNNNNNNNNNYNNKQLKKLTLSQNPTTSYNN